MSKQINRANAKPTIKKRKALVWEDRSQIEKAVDQFTEILNKPIGAVVAMSYEWRRKRIDGYTKDELLPEDPMEVTHVWIDNYDAEPVMNFDILTWFMHDGDYKGYTYSEIAKAEKKDTFLVEMAALLHDVGRAKENPPKILHADIGAKMTYNFLIKNKLVSKKEAEQITYTVACHGRGGKGWLVKIIQDADKLDGFGAIGIIRAAQHAHNLPEYLNKNGKEKTIWKKNEASKILNKREHLGRSLLENLNFQISWYNNIHTKSAKKFAKPLVNFMKNFRKSLIQQIKINPHT